METPTDETAILVKTATEISQIDAAEWDACANPEGKPYNPFLSHTFLSILEQTGCVVPDKGWQPLHLTLSMGSKAKSSPQATSGTAGPERLQAEASSSKGSASLPSEPEPDGPQAQGDETPASMISHGPILACMPCYLKGNSQGEFVFDHAWADAYHRAGGDYYPKLISAVPFTPVAGRRILVRPHENAEAHKQAMATAATVVAKKHGVSSLHVNFIPQETWQQLGSAGFLQRTDQQFHFHNPGYESFEDFLGTLASRKRKAIRKERITALSPGIEIESLTGADLKAEHWDAFHDFYEDTGARKWGRPYLNRTAFHALGEQMPDDCLLVMAKRDGRYIAGALNFIGGDCLFGRYWGATEHHPCLHFEICYYQAIDYAIAHGLPRVEAGAQGEHKLARGYIPTTTYSAHWIADSGLRGAIENYLRGERRHIEEIKEVLTDYAPYRKTEPIRLTSCEEKE
ncbi:MAG: GNAT family N-acetyltransferase [Pseudomonadota bacterium]